VSVLDDPSSPLEAEWRAVTRAIAVRDLDAEARSLAAYAALRRTVLAAAADYAQRADVRGVREVIDNVRARAIEIGGRDHNHVAALVAALEVHLADARATRLDRDKRLLRSAAARAYRAGVEDLVTLFSAARTAIDDIRVLAGPVAPRLASLDRSLTEAADELGGRTPPLEVRPAHDLLRQAFMLAAGAARHRLQAVQSADLDAAWDSAAAAAGALMLFDRATDELDRVLPQTGPN
jgi:hypothetical protein